MSLFRDLLMRLQSAVDRLLAYAFPSTRTYNKNYIKVGSIYEGDGYMNFSSSNYLRLSDDLKNTENSEYTFKFTTKDFNYNTKYIAHCEYLFSLSIYYNQIRIYNWQNRSTTTIFNFDPFTTYWVRIKIVNKNVIVSYSKNGAAYTQVYERIDNSLDSTRDYRLLLGLHSVNYSEPFDGIIRIDGCSVKIDDELLFDGTIAEEIIETDEETQTDYDYFINTGTYHINSKYALTGFYSTNNYITFPTIKPTTSFDLIVKTHTPTYFDNFSPIQATNGYRGIIYRINYNSNVRIWISSTGNSWNICNDFYPNLSIPRDTDVWFRVSWDGNTYKFGYSLNGFDFEYGNTVNNTNAPYWDNKSQNLGGCNWEGYAWYTGVIFPEDSSLSVDGSVVWRGITSPLQVGDSVTLNDGMAQSNYLWEAYDNSTELKGEFSRNSIIKTIEIDADGNTIYEVDDFEVIKNEATINTNIDSTISNYGGDPNSIVRYNVSVNNANIDSSTDVTKSESIIDTTYSVFDVELLNGYNNFLEINGCIYQQQDFPLIAKKGSSIVYKSIDEDNNIRYYKLYTLTQNKTLSKKTFTLTTNVEDPIITYKVNGNEITNEDPVQCYHNDIIDYKIEKEGYRTLEGTYTIKYTDVNVNLDVELEKLYKLMIIATPLDSIITFTTENETIESNNIYVLENTKVKWEVTKPGYIKQNGEYIIINEDHFINITLEPTVEYTAIEDKLNISNNKCDINDGFIAKADGINSYLDTEQIFDFTNAETWEIETVFTYSFTQQRGNPSVFGNLKDIYSSPSLYVNYGDFCLRIPKSYNTFHIDNVDTYIQARELRRYHFYVGQTSDYTYYVDYQYLDYDTTYGGYNENNWSSRTRAYSYKPTTTNKKTYCKSPIVFFGGPESNYFARAEIDLNRTQIVIDNETIWQGVKSFSINDFAYLNNGLGKTNNKWTAQHTYSSNKSEFTELGKVKSISEQSGSIILTLEPVKIEEVEATIDSNIDSNIITYGNLPNNITQINVDIDSDIETNSKLDSVQNSVLENHHIVNFGYLQEYNMNIEIGGISYTIADFPTSVKDNTLIAYNLEFNNKQVHYEQLHLIKDFYREKNTFKIVNNQGATIKIYGIERNTIDCYLGQPIEFEVSKEGYKTCKDIYIPKIDKLTTYNTEYILEITLDELLNYNIETNPSDANIILNNRGYEQLDNAINTLKGKITIDGDNLIETDYVNVNCTIEEVEDTIERKEYTTIIIIPDESTIEFKEIR